jgi:intein-encoded DNA endonuclease-like protein
MSIRKKRSCGKISDHQIKNIIKLYLEGNTTKEVAIMVNLSYTTIIKCLNDNNIDKRPRIRNYTLNENYFSSINTIDKAYFLGFLYADGNISKTKDGYRVKIGLQERDSYILERFSNYCDFSGPILFRKGATEKHQNQKLLQIYSKVFYENACKQGLHDAKTFTLTFPKIDPEFISHFIRGYFDGDGNVFIKTYDYQTSTSIHFLGTYEMCQSIKNHLKTTLNLQSDTKIVTKKNIFKFTINDRKDLLKIKNYLYTDSKDCFLSRKLEKFQEVEKYIREYYESHPNRY